MTDQDQPTLPLDNRRAAMPAPSEEAARNREVLDFLAHGPATAEDIAAGHSLPAQTYRPRLTTLHKAGLLVVIGKRMSPTTGKANSLYALPRTEASS